MGQDQADATAKQPGSARVVVPDLRGLTATEAMRIGMAGFVMVVCPNPNFGSARNLQGTVVRQRPEAGAAVERYAEIAVWSSGRGDDAGVREPRRPLPPVRQHQAAVDLDDETLSPSRDVPRSSNGL